MIYRTLTRVKTIFRICFLFKLACYCLAKNEKSDRCSLCYAVVHEMGIELAKSANSTEIIELAR